MRRRGGTFRGPARGGPPMISRSRRDATESVGVKPGSFPRKLTPEIFRQPGPAMTQATSATHEVLNQSPPFEDVDLFALDRPLVDAVAANGGALAAKELSEFRKHWGSAVLAARAPGPHP